jgi:hypothetical protein
MDNLVFAMKDGTGPLMRLRPVCLLRAGCPD